MIQLKSLQLKSRIIQSPMAGCTDLAFRLVGRSLGMEFAFLEMISCESLIRKQPKTFDLMKTNAEDKPLGCQLVGCRPEAMGEAAAIVESMGYDLIDVNIGCPVPKITGPGGGSALLKEPGTAQKIFKAIVKNIKKIPVTVKMRKGFKDESGNEAVRISQIAEDEGLSAVSIHGRTREQGYTGFADWKAIGKVKKAVNIPVFGNGDVNSGEDAKRLLEVSGCDGVMLGRGALGNPWIYNSVKAVLYGENVPQEPTLEERKETFLKHFKLELETEGPKLAVLKSRKIACWYFKGYVGASELRNRVNRASSSEEIYQIVEEFDSPRASSNPSRGDSSIPNSCQSPD